MNARAGQVVRLLLAIAFAASIAMPAHADAPATGSLQAPEPRVKAAFLFKFGSYVEWPPAAYASASSPFTIGVMDADELANELTTIVAGHAVDGRSVIVRRLREGDAVTGLNILFVGKAGSDRLADILTSMKGRATLAVTESDGALERGSMINFVVVDGRIRFDVALQSAAAGSLKISSRLLSVARKVTGPT